ncbi:hypothetical protein Tco_0994553, partial [Tanacetum coccineum]
SHPTSRVQACFERPTGDLSRPPSTTLLTTLPPSVPREAFPLLAPPLNHKLSKVIIIESDTSCDHKPFQATSNESSDHNPFEATSDESSDHNPFQATSDESSDHNHFQATFDESSDHNPFEATSDGT